MPRVTMVTYHYVRDIAGSQYPRIKGLETALFQEQLWYLISNYTIIGMDRVLEYLKHKTPLPENPLVLMFDDGYKDHIDTVLPILQGIGISGSFFPPGKAVFEHKVLDVNKIHFILATVDDPRVLIEDIHTRILELAGTPGLVLPQEYHARMEADYHLPENRLDVFDVIYVKRLLQKYLPESVRRMLTDELFLKYVTDDEAAFAQELYMSADDIRHLREQGMFIGSHTWNHHWLNALSPEEQEIEVKKSVEMLKIFGCDTREWVMCYPYGGNNATLHEILKRYGCVMGITTDQGIYDLDTDNPFAVPRLDTNDLPKSSNAEPNSWTKKATQ